METLVITLAQEREKLRWTASGGGLMMLFCLLSAYHHKSFLHLLPVFPTVTYLGYQVHYCYGNKLSLIEEMSAKLHQEYPNNLALPPVNIQEMGQGISSQKFADLKKLEDNIIEGEIVLKNLQLAQEQALKIAESRERFTWEFAGVATMVCILLVAGSISKRKDFAIPIAPLIMGLGYRYEYAFGTSIETIVGSAEALLNTNDEKLRIVGGPLTLKEVDAYRVKYF
ncbi:hypothetical protein DICVIV_01904 [Dictyocaulus viviparus]|uniref:Uncharacterized protein n=1 Tax=Dictyocaulus viviparus TaxID=29172 RepID=A0A0D8Y4Y3_DICVI|nr:hypothetical protein DICVIV_01904 [Dictyocaulus viviparus]